MAKVSWERFSSASQVSEFIETKKLKKANIISIGPDPVWIGNFIIFYYETTQ